MTLAESRIQQEIVMWFRNNYCRVGLVPRCVIFSVPNEGQNEVEQMRKVQTGLMAGASDLIVIMPNVTIYVECKDDKGSQSDEQIVFQELVEALGFRYVLVRSLDDFKSVIL